MPAGTAGHRRGAEIGDGALNGVEAGLLAQAALAGAGLIAAVSLPARARAVVAGTLSAALGVAGVVTGALALAGQPMVRAARGVVPALDLTLRVDPLSGVFLLVVGLVTAAAGIYGIGYVRHPEQLHDHGELHDHGGGIGAAGSRTTWAGFVVFVAGMQLVVVAGSAAVFVIGWEVMAAASLLLVLTEHREHAAVRGAALWYAGMTQLGFLAVLGCLAVLVTHAGAGDFAALRAASGGLDRWSRVLVATLALVGFGSKAGAVPLHVWLPRAHPEAPSHVSAVMSGAMVKLGVYGLLRVGVDLLGGAQPAWGLVLLGIGAASALYGILQAVVATDLKRLLAYSTTENVGLILVGVGAGVLLAGSGRPDLAAVAYVAALLHTINHAAFKGLLFLGAGSVLRATGLRDLDGLGGLVSRMPVTTALIGVGALAAAALPPGNGFVSEWLLLQSLVHGQAAGGVTTALVMPAGVGVVALTAGLAVATFVKAFGTGFLARPRTPAAEAAVESPVTMRAGMFLLAGAVAVLAVAPATLARGLDRAAAVLTGATTPTAATTPLHSTGGGLALEGLAARLQPLLVLVLLVVAAVAVASAARLWGRPRRTQALAWGCGGERLSPRMEYTATSFAEPLQRVFAEVLQPEQDLMVTPTAAPYLDRRVRYSQRMGDAVEQSAYRPVLALLVRVGERARGLAPGGVHRYVGYAFAALLAVLVAVSW
jgi:formate hydrogenlyase subunit 3/multisubunit Na+/H+ antiporter MnhD subunit